jgi:hypothetical protein
MPTVRWTASFQGQGHSGSAFGPLPAALALVSGNELEVVQAVASRLAPDRGLGGRWLVIELDPIAQCTDLRTGSLQDVLDGPTVHGAARALRMMIGQLGASMRAGVAPLLGHVTVGDVAAIVLGDDALEWIDAIRALASMLVAVNAGAAVIAYDSAQANGGHARWHATRQSDLTIDAPVDGRSAPCFSRSRVAYRDSVARRPPTGRAPRTISSPRPSR